MQETHDCVTALAQLTNLHIGHSVLVFVDGEVRLRHFRQNKDPNRITLVLKVTF